MSEEKHWFRNFVVAPLVVTLVGALFVVHLNRPSKMKPELSYRVDPPTAFLSPRFPDVKVVVGNRTLSDPVLYRISVWNSGDTTLLGLPVSIVFQSDDRTFSIIAAQHYTVPGFEFGKITDTPPESVPDGFHARRFVYSQLDPGDIDQVSLLTNGRGRPQVYSKAKGFQLTVVNQTNRRPSLILFAVVAMLVSIAATFLPRAVHSVPRWIPSYRLIKVPGSHSLSGRKT